MIKFKFVVSEILYIFQKFRHLVSNLQQNYNIRWNNAIIPKVFEKRLRPVGGVLHIINALVCVGAAYGALFCYFQFNNYFSAMYKYALFCKMYAIMKKNC